MIDKEELRHLVIAALVIAALYYAYCFGFEDGQNWQRITNAMRSTGREYP